MRSKEQPQPKVEQPQIISEAEFEGMMIALVGDLQARLNALESVGREIDRLTKKRHRIIYFTLGGKPGFKAVPKGPIGFRS